MTIHEIDNSDQEAFGKTILWQYDKAANLNRLISFFKEFYDVSVAEFWDQYPEHFIGLDTADYGLAIWGELIGEPRPYYYDDDAGKVESVSDEMYRRVLKAVFYLMKTSGTSKDIVDYVRMIFRCESDHGKSGILVKDLGGMAMEYKPNEDYDEELGKTPFADMTEEARKLFSTAISTKLNIEGDRLLDSARELLPYPAGVRYNTKPNEVIFGFAGQERPSGGTVAATIVDKMHASSITTLDDEDDISIRVGSWELGDDSDPVVGSFCENGNTGSYQETTFVSNDILQNFALGV